MVLTSFAKYLTFRSKVKTNVTMVPNTKSNGHSPTYKLFFSFFTLGIKGQGQINVMFVRNTPSYDHAPTYKISLTYLEGQNSYGQDKLHQLFNLYSTFGSKVNVKQMS